MSIKLKLSEDVFNGLPASLKDDYDLKKLVWSMWRNPRKADSSFGLTDEGYELLAGVLELKFYRIDLPDSLFVTNKIRIWLDKYIDCPFYLTSKSIFVSREKVAVQLILYSGDLTKFGLAKESSKKNQEYHQN